MDPVKLSGVADWPAPKRLKDTQAFMGFANFYRRFIKDFSEITRPMNDLTKKNTPWNWGMEQQQAFDILKKKFTEAPVLRMADPSKKY